MLSVAVKENQGDGIVPGKFEVDDQCVDCDLHSGICSDCFGRDEEVGNSVVVKQPETEEETNL
jgi:ferredoxin